MFNLFNKNNCKNHSLIKRYANLLKFNCNIEMEGYKGTPCYSSKFSALIFNNSSGRIISFGYNGPPSKFPHSDSECWLTLIYDQLTSKEKNILKVNNLSEFVKKLKNSRSCLRKVLGYCRGERLDLCPCSHAEINTIINANNSIFGQTMMIYNTTPCRDCAKYIINSGLKKVIVATENVFDKYDDVGLKMLSLSKIKIEYLLI